MAKQLLEELRLERWVGEAPPGAGAGMWVAQLTDDWSFRSPAGGVLTSLALAAMREQLGLRAGSAALAPLSCTANFISVVPAGPVLAKVELLRQGAAVCQLRARISRLDPDGIEGELGLEVTANFGVAREGPAFCAAVFPEVPRPAECPPGTGGVPFAPGVVPQFFQRFETRRASGADFWSEGWAGGSPHHARWIRFIEPALGEDGCLDPIVLASLADTMPPSVAQYLGAGFKPFIAPSLDLTVHFFETTRREWLLCSARAVCAYRGYASALIEIWDDERRLLATGTQVMMLRSVKAQLPAS